MVYQIVGFIFWLISLTNLCRTLFIIILSVCQRHSWSLTSQGITKLIWNSRTKVKKLTKAKPALCSQWGNDAFGSNRCVWKRGTAWEGAAIIDGLCYLGAWLGVTPGLVGFSGNSWNRHDEKERWVRVTEMKLKDNARAIWWDSWGGKLHQHLSSLLGNINELLGLL